MKKMNIKIILSFLGYFLVGAFFFSFGGQDALAQQANLPGVAINFGQGTNLVDTLEVLLLFTVLTLAPAIIILCTSFSRIVIVLAFMRQALGTQNMPPNQLLIGFALFLSMFVMMPTGTKIYENAIVPYQQKTIDGKKAFRELESSLREFMVKHVRKTDIGLFYDVTGTQAPADVNSVPTHYLIPAFIISELKTAFQIGFLLYIPFIVLDMVVASVLMAMGMMMLPPMLVSMPFKLLLFVLVDGWQLVSGAILRSFN